MPDPLSYQPSRSAVYYTPPQRIDIPRTIIGLLIATVLIAIGSSIYAIVLPRLNNPLFRIGAVVAAALAVGAIALIPVRMGRVRIALVAACIGAALSMLALYVMWVVWLHRVLDQWTGQPHSFVLDPIKLQRMMRIVNGFGTFTWHNDPVNGPGLAILWIVEACMMLVAGVLFPTFKLFHSDPTCLDCGGRCVQAGKLPRFSAERQHQFLSALENRDYAALASHPAADHEDDPELTLQLLSCRDCGKTNVLTVNHIAWYVDRESGRGTVRTKELINQLLIPPDEADQLRAVCGQIREQRNAASEASSAEESPA
jgi:hypothetical protein